MPRHSIAVATTQKRLDLVHGWPVIPLVLNYQGSFEDAKSYEDGNGDLVLDTLYRVQKPRTHSRTT